MTEQLIQDGTLTLPAPPNPVLERAERLRDEIVELVAAAEQLGGIRATLLVNRPRFYPEIQIDELHSTHSMLVHVLTELLRQLGRLGEEGGR